MAGHKFNVERAEHLDGRVRRFLAPAGRILADIETQPGETWAEIGAGTGYFVVPLASRVEKVHALDLSDQMLALLSQNLAVNNVTNVDVVKSEESRLPLPAAGVDAVLLAQVLHEVDAPELFLSETFRITRPGGRLLIIEYTHRGSFGPPRSHRLTSRQIDDWTTVAGYQTARSWRWARKLIGYTYFELIGLEYRKQP